MISPKGSSNLYPRSVYLKNSILESIVWGQKISLQATSESNSATQEKKSIGLVIPTYNEGGNIQTLLSRIEQAKASLVMDLKVIVVDDNSKDGTAEIVRQQIEKSKDLKLIERPKPTGIGTAYLDGFAYGLKICRSDYLGEIDADLQHPPEVLIEMAKVAKQGVDVVIASRYISGGGSSGWSLWRRMVSKGANGLTRMFVRAPVKDSTSGFRLLSSRAVQGLLEYDLSSKGYSFQIESLYVYRKLGMTFAEVPYTFEERKVGETKLKSKEVFRFAFVAMKLGIFGMPKKKNSSSNTTN
jgi:dolichol-phosphate mannosyltransferase